MKLQNLNTDQLNGLAKHSFDLAKGAFLIGLFPAVNGSVSPYTQVIYMATGVFLGVAFTYAALLLLQLKEEKL